MPGGIRLNRFGQDVGHFLRGLAGIRKTSRSSCRQNARSQRCRIRSGGAKNRLIGNVRDDLAPEMALCAAPNRNIALHGSAQRFFDTQRAKVLFESQPLQDCPVEMRELMNYRASQR